MIRLAAGADWDLVPVRQRSHREIMLLKILFEPKDRGSMFDTRIVSQKGSFGHSIAPVRNGS